VTGFDLPDIDLLIGELSLAAEGDDPADAIVEAAVGPTISRPGDIWQIGTHRLICGDSTQLETYQRLLGTARAQMVFTDPPYNVPIAGHVGGLGSIQHREFVMASGEMSQGEFTDFLRSVFQHLAAFSVDGTIHFQCMDWRHVPEILAAGTAAYADLKNICVWAKNNGGMGSLYRSQHEFVFVFKSGTAPHINNIELGKHGRYRTNVWSYVGVNSFGEDRGDLTFHPTVKPVAMVADAIRDCSHRRGIILDAFVGSGTTLIAAEKTGRRGYGIEIDPAYCDVAIRRMGAVCGLEAVLEASGRTFAEAEQTNPASGATYPGFQS
jgi:DNA modification methylase